MTEAPDGAVVNELLAHDETRVSCQLAYWLNLSRVDRRLSRTREATRSTMLWSLMVTDEGVRSAFAAAGVDIGPWTRQLGLRSDPTDLRRELESAHAGDTDTPAFHHDLLDAFDRHLPEHRADDGSAPTAAQLALAVLDSLETGGSTELPTRLDQLNFDLDVAVRRLEAPPATRSVRLDDFSASVRHVIGRIGLDNDVTPSRLAAELATLHPDYADGLLGTVDFDDDDTTPYPLADLLATIRHMAGDVAPGDVIHTRQVVVHLASFDDNVRSALQSVGALDALLVELGLTPDGEGAADVGTTPPPVDRPALDMLADIPIDDPDFDVMNFGPYVDAVVQLIENPRTTTPLSIAVNGPWGSGKTSLGRMVETQLRHDQEDRLVPIITWFNAWLHDSADDLGAALTAHVGRELNAHRRPLRRFLQLLPKNMLTAQQRYYRKVWIAGLGLLIAFTVAFGWVRLTTDGTGAGGDETVAGAAAEGGAGAALILAILAAASRFVDPARSAAAFIASPRSEAQEGALNEARKEIGKLLNQAGVPTARTMVIFVDDLERSRPPSAIDICEAANQLLDHPGVFIIYLADMAKIASTVEIKYKDYAEWASSHHRTPVRIPPDGSTGANGSETSSLTPHNGNGWWGRAYMEKMVQIQIDIPELDRTAGSDLLRLMTEHSRAAAARRQEELRQRSDVSWPTTVTFPLRAAADWLENRRKRALVERLYRLVDSNRESGTLDVETFEAEARDKGIGADVIGRVIQRNTEESATYRAAEAVAVDYLPNNPRAIKRLANRLRFEAEVSDELELRFGSDWRLDPRLVGKWAVLTTRWPTLTESLRDGRLDGRDLETLPREKLADRVKQHVRPGVAEHEVDHLTRLLAAEPHFGARIDRFLYHRLTPSDEGVR